ncbi:reverse transcriptase [Phytophthora megakarya]|uniref:Reverse transcriptase n=1 Tax=Phytophthora megakarya TaxID=4795 RepID=A0A225W2N1_9STRA|nr:reverse transcriptase [Phytophthora megakarya]
MRPRSIYQRMIDNALYGFTRIPKSEDHGGALDVFEDGEPVDPGKPSVLGRRSYIDDIRIPAKNWDQLCDRVEGFLEACDKWNLSISVVKSFWGMPKVEHLGHKVSYNGLEANPKDLSALTALAFPGLLRAMQSFLGSLNYYSRFIEDYAIYASTLDLEAQDLTEVDPRWIHAYRSFSVLKAKIATTPILRHFDPDRSATIVVYASDWAVSGSLMQEYDKIYYPVMFASQKEVLALLRILDLNYNALVGRPIHVLPRHSTLAWLFRSTALQGRLGQWVALLSPWTLETTKCVKGEDEILGALAASITPRSEVDKALISIASKKKPRRKIQAPIPTIKRDEELYVVSFDGSARVKRGGGAYSAILWKLPEWRVLKARSGYAEGLTVNEGLLLCLDLLEDLDPRRLVICGDSNLVIRQVRGEIDCKAPGLTLLRQRALDRLRVRPDHELLHVKRDWNGSADSLASASLQRQCGIEVETEEKIQDLVTLNRLDEILMVKIENEIAQISAVTTRSKARSGVRIGSDPDSLREEVVRELRIERIRQAQDEEPVKKYLVGEIRDLTQEEAKVFGSIAINYEVDQLRQVDALVVPETLQQDVLHRYHTSLQGGHQGIGRTYDRIRDHFHWRGLYKSVQQYVGECVDCETGKERPRIQRESPGNLQATFPFQIIAMDHIPSLS